jgi:alpha-L-fucosidase 2
MRSPFILLALLLAATAAQAADMTLWYEKPASNWETEALPIVSTTPELAEAAKVPMNARGDASTGWSRAWKTSVWAPLQDGDLACKILSGLIRTSITPNLLATHPPFQIDADFGYAAGVSEMVLQSHEENDEGRIQKSESQMYGESFITHPSSFALSLLPALPKAWPDGKVTGLRARGGFTVDIEWKDGKVTKYRIASPEPREVKVRVNGDSKTIRSEKL